MPGILLQYFLKIYERQLKGLDGKDIHNRGLLFFADICLPVNLLYDS